ncbi:hypothetical protein [Pilimelia anulata]|uniref:hypothetical protein n=1 Tax=Pilimelia anulata TaxID=53371 RepID=UPI00166651AD|nr:hypothetical protein [Pilimelia anulata]
MLPALVAVLAPAAPADAVAGWGASTASRSGTIGMARATYAFAGGGADPARARLDVPFALFTATGYATLTNTGPTAASFAGPVTATGLSAATRVTVTRCAVAFNTTFGTCGSGSTLLVDNALLTGAPTAPYGSLAAGQTRYLKITIVSLVAVAGSVGLDPLAGTLPVGGANRTNG